MFWLADCLNKQVEQHQPQAASKRLLKFVPDKFFQVEELTSVVSFTL
jgi:hypothetical protein